MQKLIYLSFLFVILSACSNSVNEPEPVQVGDYELTRIPNTEVDRAQKLHETGVVVEEGYLLNGKKFGQWVTYDPKSRKVTSITNYVDNNLDGIFLKFSNREQIDMKTSYKMNQLDGKYEELNFGRATKEAEYVNGELNGIYKEYYSNGKLLKEVEYKNGVQDGTYRYYDEKGNVTIEYEYKNGEKISGGMVN